jgi:hypothetical protein
MNEVGERSFSNLVQKRRAIFASSSAAPTWMPSKFGPGVKYTRASSQKATETYAAWMSVKAITLSAWINLPGASTANYHQIMDRDNFGASQRSFQLRTVGGGGNAGKLEFIPFDATTNGSIISNTVVVNSGWHHVVATYLNTAPAAYDVYIDGVKDATTKTDRSGDLRASTADLAFGTDQSAGGFYMEGWIDNCSMWSRALTAREIWQLYKDPFVGVVPFKRIKPTVSVAVPGAYKSIRRRWGAVKPGRGWGVDTADPINKGMFGCWLFNESNGLKAYDLCQGKYHGDLTSSPKWSAGRFGPGINVVSGSYVDMAGLAGNDSRFTSSSSATFTVASWFKTTNTALQFLVDTETASNTEGFSILTNMTGSDGGCFGARTKNGSSQYLGRASTTVVADGKWHFCVAVVKANTTDYTQQDIQLYVDGVSNQGTLTNAGVSAAPASTTFRVGARRSGANPFNGTIDHIRLWSRAITPAEMKRLYTEPFAGILGPRVLIGSVAAAGGSYTLSLANAVFSLLTASPTSKLRSILTASALNVLGTAVQNKTTAKLTAPALAITGASLTGRLSFILSAASLSFVSPALNFVLHYFLILTAATIQISGQAVQLGGNFIRACWVFLMRRRRRGSS